jgi:hypothetical protein
VALAEAWLSTKEAELNSDEIGDSLDNVDALLKKHDTFESALAAQSDRITALSGDARTLREKNSIYADEVDEMEQKVLQRHQQLLVACQERRKMLVDSRHWHAFLRACAELMTWLNAKLQIAYDESYLDQTNLQSKLQRHLAFDAELKADQVFISASKLQSTLNFFSDSCRRDHTVG